VLHKNTDISFAPSVTAGLTVNILPVRNVELGLISKYVGIQYMDNTKANTGSWMISLYRISVSAGLLKKYCSPNGTLLDR
jgi:hypothetical protein